MTPFDCAKYMLHAHPKAFGLMCALALLALLVDVIWTLLEDLRQ